MSGQGKGGTGGRGGRGGDRAAVRAGRWKVEIARPDKVLFPDDGITKLDLAEYYARVAPAMLPHVRGRPVAMERYPDGLNGQRFFQKNVNGSVPEWVHTAKVGKQRGFLTQIVCDNAATLVYLADQACITPHVWLSRVDRPQHPDQGKARSCAKRVWRVWTCWSTCLGTGGRWPSGAHWRSSSGWSR